MAKVIAVVNQKGGVGKTTVTINLGIGLANAGKNVLLIDFDPQGSLTDCMGFAEPDMMDLTVTQLLMDGINGIPFAPQRGILRHAEGVDVLPGNIELSGLEVTLVNVMCRETVLKNYIRKIASRYDYILIDCLPSLGILTVNVLAAADSVIIPIKAEKPSTRGLQQLIRSIAKVRENLNPDLNIMGMIPNMVDIRTRYHKDTVDLLEKKYGFVIPVFPYIPLSTRMAETAAEGTSIFVHDGNGKAAEAYRNLIADVLEIEEVQEDE